jgi:hypothetical protein
MLADFLYTKFSPMRQIRGEKSNALGEYEHAGDITPTKTEHINIRVTTSTLSVLGNAKYWFAHFFPN